MSMQIPWIELALFMSAIGFAALYGLTVSGHFPAEFRADELKGETGAVILWGTLALTGMAAVATLVVAWRVLPWYAIVIGGGAVLLATPLLLRPFPDWFVNGRAGLLAFAAGATVSAALMWIAA
jgi:hypothetical protein